jgi:hypothetical protein
MSDQTSRPPRSWWKIAGAILIVLILLAVIIPGVRASISSWLGLSVASSTQVTITPAALETAIPPTPVRSLAKTAVLTTLPQTETAQTEGAYPTSSQPEGTLGIAAEIRQLATQAGWEIPLPSHLPEGYHFQSAFFDTNNKMLILTYLVTRPLPGTSDPSLTSTESISLLQAQKNDFVPMQIAPNTNVTDIEVNGLPAAFTVGGWDTEFVKDNTSPNGGKMVSSWRNDLPVKNLYWQVGKIYLALVTTDAGVSQQDLVEMASSIGK